jgi:hypothetical protein
MYTYVFLLMKALKTQSISQINQNQPKQFQQQRLGNSSIPSPQGDLRVVMWRTLVGILTGPLTLSCLSLAPFTKSAQTEMYQKGEIPHNC